MVTRSWRRVERRLGGVGARQLGELQINNQAVFSIKSVSIHVRILRNVSKYLTDPASRTRARLCRDRKCLQDQTIFSANDKGVRISQWK